MGSRNSEILDSIEFADFIGHNYAPPAITKHYQLYFHQEEGALDSHEVLGEPFPPKSQARMRKQIDLIINDGTGSGIERSTNKVTPQSDANEIPIVEV